MFNSIRFTPLLVITMLTLTSLSTPLFAQGEFQSGSAKSIQDDAVILQSRGADQRVDYLTLTKYGPWDDRNYNVTRVDLALIPEKDQYLHNIPVFFKIFLRKEQPNLGEFYPRSALQYFQILHGGLLVNGKLYKEGLGIGYHRGRSAATEATRNAKNEVILDLNVRGNEVSVEHNPLNKLELVAGSNRSGGQTMYYSDDGGITWNFSQTNPSSCCDPTIGWSSDGSRVYQADLSSTIGVRWAVSNDKGQTWGPMQVLTTSGSDKEFLHVDQSATSPHLNNIYLTYHNSNVMQFARSTDMGASFSTPIAFASEPRGIGSDITTDAAGNIYYFYPALGGQGIRLLRSTDGGINFGSSTQVAPLNGIFDFPIPSMETREAFIYVSADVDVDTGDIYVAWTDEAADSVGGGSGSAANNHAWIQVAKSTDQGITWVVLPHPHDATDLISGAPIDRFHPWIHVENGVVHIIYYDTRNSVNRTGVDLYYAVSTDGVGSWETEQRFSTETSDNLTDGQEWGDYNGLSVVLDNIVATWTDNRPSNDPVSADDKVAMAGKGKDEEVGFKHEYAAKFVCGLQKDPWNMRLTRGYYASAINIHNPNDGTVKFYKKLALTFPPKGQRPGKIIPIGKDELKYDEALEVDCEEIDKALKESGIATPYSKGFVIIQSSASLDVTVVYTTAALDKEGRVTDHSSIDVEQISERIIGETEQKLADLVPVPDQGGFFCKKRDGELVVTVKNQGTDSSVPSVTAVDFPGYGQVLEPTPALNPGQTTDIFFKIPFGCHNPDCDFKITVDVNNEVSEKDETNNTGIGLCIG